METIPSVFPKYMAPLRAVHVALYENWYPVSSVLPFIISVTLRLSPDRLTIPFVVDIHIIPS